MRLIVSTRFPRRTWRALLPATIALLLPAGLLVAQDVPRVPQAETQPAAASPATAPAAPAAPAGPATAPAVATTRPSGVSAEMARHFANLASHDPSVREEARIALMGLSARDLPALQSLVKANLPLDAGQVMALHEVVTHVYLAGDRYDALDSAGFLGVKLGDVMVGPQPAAAWEPEPADPFGPRGLRIPPQGETGVVILERYPGFCGARMLRDGDVVLGVAERGNLRIGNTTEMRQAVVGFGAGQKITFHILRQGRVVAVPVVLDPRPDAVVNAGFGGNSMEALAADRRERAADYWARVFAPLINATEG